MPGARIFFSYAREDSGPALRIARDLRAAGVLLFVYQDDISAGTRWDDAIEEALAESEEVLVVLSPRAVKSRNVKDEIGYALEEQKRLLPILLETCSIPLRLRRLQHVDFTEDHAAGMEQLLRSLGVEAAPADPGPAPEQRADRATAPAVASSGGPLGRPETITAGGGYELILIPGGTFQMGSPADEEGRDDDEGPQHEVTVEDFYLGRHPVTNEQYARFLEANPEAKKPKLWDLEDFNHPKQPVVGVTWREACAYCGWAGLALPTEAQWEYACRGVAHRCEPYSSGESVRNLHEIAWTARNSGARTHPVCQKLANDFGLYDMHGNVWEWCQDCWSDDYTLSQRVHPGAFEPETDNRNRVLRGGGCATEPEHARSAARFKGLDYRIEFRGFRPASRVT